MRARRALCDPADGLLLAKQLLDSDALRAGDVVAGYWPLPGEIDVRPLLWALAGRGHSIALPITPAAGGVLTFHRWRPDQTLRPGRFGTSEPEPDLMRPDLVLVPLLAFDRAGFRLGYGGGFYDRTLAGLPAVRTVGCAFACQEVQAVPREPHDRRLDLIATEAFLHRVA